MSDEDQGDEGKSFLSRWSQRKQEAKQPERDKPIEADVPSTPVAETDAEPEFDLSSLPKLEDLTATTDITAFLRKGVPESLRNAALRKSWALDPAIRNYVNPALDYAYDWNTPGGVPGSSEIGAGMDVARLVSQIMGGGELVIRIGRHRPPNPVTSRSVLRPNFWMIVQRKKRSPICRRRPCDWATRRTSAAIETAECRGRAAQRGRTKHRCCTAASGATPWLGKTHCLDKSFCRHRKSLCYDLVLE